MWSSRARELMEQLEPVAESRGLKIIEIEFPQNTGGILRIFVDSLVAEKPVTVDDCATFSPIVSAYLDTRDDFDFRYHLEVSSPGLDRPVRRWEELSSFIGKKIYVAFTEKIGIRRKAVGELLSVDVAGDSFVVRAEDGEVAVPRALVKRINVVWEGDK